MKPRTAAWIATWFIVAIALFTLALFVSDMGRVLLFIAAPLAIGVAIWPAKKPERSPWD
jgi:4-hydroxybenzoate polyprenyltransferase